MRNARKIAEALLDEAELLVTPIGWVLREIIGQERLEEAYPIESDESQRYGDVTIIIVARVTGGAICNPAEDAQQSQLVGRRLVVIEDNMPDQRQRAGPVVRQSDEQMSPAN